MTDIPNTPLDETNEALSETVVPISPVVADHVVVAILPDPVMTQTDTKQTSKKTDKLIVSADVVDENHTPQPKAESELFRTIHPLTDERRLEAHNRAKTLVVKAAGDQPDRKNFNQHTESKYPSWMNLLINGLTLFVLLAAFAPSAIRLYQIGSTTFRSSIDDVNSAIAAGISIVLMAELAMVLFSIASVVMSGDRPTNATEDEQKKYEAKERGVQRLLILGQIVATAIAVVGNAQMSLTQEHITNLFAWIEAFAPSILVFSTSFVLKAQLLSSVSRRYANKQAYEAALNKWNIVTADPENDPNFRNRYASALRDFLKEDNSKGSGANMRKEYMAMLLTEDWIALVKRELRADNWYVEVAPTANSNLSDASVQTDRQHNRQTDNRTRNQTARLSDRQTLRQTDNRTGVSDPADRQTIGQTDRQRTTDTRIAADTSDRQTDTQTDSDQTAEAPVVLTGKVLAAYRWFLDNPDKVGMGLRALEAEIDAGKDAITKARHIYNSNVEVIAGE